MRLGGYSTAAVDEAGHIIRGYLLDLDVYFSTIDPAKMRTNSPLPKATGVTYARGAENQNVVLRHGIAGAVALVLMGWNYPPESLSDYQECVRVVTSSTGCSEAKARGVVNHYLQQELAFLREYKGALERCAAYLDANLTLEGDHVTSTIRSFFVPEGASGEATRDNPDDEDDGLETRVW